MFTFFRNNQLSPNQRISNKYSENIKLIKAAFENCSDIAIREFKIGVDQKVAAFAVILVGLIDETAIRENLIKPLMLAPPNINKRNAFKYAKESAISISRVKEVSTLEDSVSSVIRGNCALFIDGWDKALVTTIKAYAARSVDEPDTEAVVRGPREGFVESIRTNTALIRRIIKTSNLKLESIVIGEQTQTEVCVVYIKGIANDKIVKEVKSRLQKIDVGSILESGYIESFIEDAPYSPFPTVGNSEKPDVVSAKILDGRVAILVDGTPFVLTVPCLFVEAFQSSEDYYSRPFYASLVRLLRWIAFFTSIYLPSLYVAVTAFNREVLPTPLMISIAAATNGLPFPALLEALIMQIVYEILREAGVRLPRPIGQAVSIVGALVIGEASVSAGLIGAPMVIVVALTAISSFVVPALADVNFIFRLILLLLSGLSGFYGIMLGTAIILTHVVSLRSFGVPYTSPIAPLTLSDIKDAFIRPPLWTMLKRPGILRTSNTIKQKYGNKPTPPKNLKRK